MNVELLGAWPFKHDINGSGTIAGAGKVAETKQLPPTLVLNYMFNPQSNIRPYIGAGINYTTFFSTKTTGALAGTDMKLDDSWGAAADAGVDVDINKDWFFNASVWYMNITTTAHRRWGQDRGCGHQPLGVVRRYRHALLSLDPACLPVG